MKILIAPLDWGLGHATRCVPVIEAFLEAKAEVIIGSCANLKSFFAEAFPQLEQVELPSYGIEYPTHGYQMPAWLLSQLPRLQKIVKEEHKIVESIVESQKIDVVFSDNRFGAYSTKVPSVYMTHQLRIAFPFASRFLEGFGVRFHAEKMSKFSEIWVPDLPDFPGFAGRLSHEKINKPCRYIGPLSRFLEISKTEKPKANIENQFCFLGMVSGVEPMRTHLENLLLEAFQKLPGKHALLLGKPEIKEIVEKGNVVLYPHLSKEKFRELVLSAKYFVSRPGYSTIMDQAVLGANCLFVPTPGQTEQIYLSKIISKFRYARVMKESKLSAESLEEAFAGSVYRLPFADSSLLKKAVFEFMEQYK